jgi:dihydrofolate reductase
MRKVVATEFVSLDGVMESPDKWHFPYFDEEMDQAVGEGFAACDAMLMGRVNYEEWAAYWPQQDLEENPRERGRSSACCWWGRSRTSPRRASGSASAGDP